MPFFWKRKHDQEDAAREAEIKRIRKETFKQIDATNKSIDQATKKIVNFHHIADDDDIALMIYHATGGDRRDSQ